MGLFDLLRRLLFGAPPAASPGDDPPPRSANSVVVAPAESIGKTARGRTRPLAPLRYQTKLRRTPPDRERVRERPYTFAAPTATGDYLDLSTDANLELLEHLGLPRLQ